jgi:uncharacterized protein (UPF0210 family)
MSTVSPYQDLFRVRTVTCFLEIEDDDFVKDDLRGKIAKAARFLRHAERTLTQTGYTVQTVRIATNPFGEWLAEDNAQGRLQQLDSALEEHQISFCALGCAETSQEVQRLCAPIVAFSSKFSCSANLRQHDTDMARAAASCILQISRLGGQQQTESAAGGAHVKDGLGNFRFGVAAAVKPYIPFFPAAKSVTSGNVETKKRFKFALGLENGALARQLLAECRSIRQIPDKFRHEMNRALEPLQCLCQQLADTEWNEDVEFIGIDTSLNPSLDEGGSVAKAIESLEEVDVFGGPGTLAAAAAVTQCLQSLPNVQHCGYSGLMLPLCEDQRLADLASQGSLRLSDLLSISHVCGESSRFKSVCEQ